MHARRETQRIISPPERYTSPYILSNPANFITPERVGLIEPLLTDRDLKLITGRARSTWQKARLAGGPKGPPFIRIGRLVRYRRVDVEAWLSAHHAFRSTSEADGGTCDD
jgi:predicted DNA-binding transcriptional regulator AlpA